MVKVSDPYGRVLDNIRLAVTDECNYRCIFCHMEGEPVEGPARPGMGHPLLTPEDYYIIAKAGSLLDVEKYKVTGGEPLLRRDIVEIVSHIHSGAESSEISMTTNGYFLSRYAGRLAEEGLKRVNISIHSLREERYQFITGIPGLRRALEGLKAALSAGLGVKINMVVLRGVNEDEIIPMAHFAGSIGATLQLIELHPVGLGAKFFSKYHYPLSLVEKKLLSLGAQVTYRSLHNRPIYILPGGERVEIVKPVGNPFFCAGCTRIRIGPYGDLLPCINYRGRRPLIVSILHNRKLSLEEKIAGVAEALIDLVSMRRPFYMCTLDNCKRDGRPPAHIARLNLSKRVLYEQAKREIRARLGLVEVPASKVLDSEAREVPLDS